MNLLASLMVVACLKCGSVGHVEAGLPARVLVPQTKVVPKVVYETQTEYLPYRVVLVPEWTRTRLLHFRKDRVKIKSKTKIERSYDYQR